MRVRVLASLLSLVLLTLGVVALLPRGAQGEDTPIQWRPDVEFGRAGTLSLRMNLALPAAKPGTRHPAILIFHGGAWVAGERGRHNALARWFAEQGYVAATASYRLAPAHPWPAQIEDAKCAVRFLRAEAASLGIDPDRIGAMGFSAGAHLAMLLGTMDPQDGLEGEGGHGKVRSQVDAVVSFFGPSNLDAPPQDKLQELSQAAMHRVLGEAFRADPSRASPVRYVDDDDAPLLHFQGTQDRLVPYALGQALVTRLQEAGMRAEVVFLVGAGHGWGEPHLTDTLNTTLRFFDRQLRPERIPRVGIDLRQLR